MFEKIHTPNSGWDCCWIGQQIHEYVEKRMLDFGFETIAGDTDSLFLVTSDVEKNNKEYVKNCLKTVVKEIKENVPFPVETFDITIEHYLEYLMYPFSEQPIVDEKTGKNKKIKNRLVKELKGTKKNYLYIYNDNGKRGIELVGLPITKDNATILGMKIFNEVLKEEILKQGRAKFSKKYITDIVQFYLQKEEIMKLIAVEYRVNPFNTYKNPSQIQAQISKQYFDGNEGLIYLIKNKKIGKIGVGAKYCTIQEALDNNLTVDDLYLDKLWKELEIFIEHPNS